MAITNVDLGKVRGEDGSQWYQGTGITGESTTATVFTGSGVSAARVNDCYLNNDTGNTYHCTVAGAPSAAKWVYTGCIKGGAGGGGSAAVVTFLRSGWTAGDSGYTQTMSVPGLTDAAEPQLQLPKNATSAQAAVWDSIKQSVPAAGNITLTVDSQPGTDLDVIVLGLPAQDGVTAADLVQVSQRISQNTTDIAALEGDVTQINANLNDIQIPIQPWHTDEIIIGTFNGKDLYEKCISIYGGNLTANSTKSIKHDIQIGDIISINKTCVYSNSHAFSDILWWEPGNTSEYLACNFTKTDIKLICAGSWSGDVKTYFKVQYTK